MILLGGGNRPDEPRRHSRRPQRARVHAGVTRGAVRDRPAVELDHVLEPEPGAADSPASGVDAQAIVEARRVLVPNVGGDRQRLDPLVLQRGIAPVEPRKVLDAGHLEPDEVDRVVGDPLRVCLGEPHLDVGREAEAVHARTLDTWHGFQTIDGSLEERLDELADGLGKLDRRVRSLEEAIRRPVVGQLGPPGPSGPRPALSETAAEPSSKPRPRRRDVLGSAPDLEELLGGRVLAWLGGLAIVLGVVFFLVMAVSRGWIDEPTRVVLAFGGSSLLLALGLYLYERQGKTQAALATVGTAIAALYASLTAATQLYELVQPAVGLALAALMGATATAIAVRWGSPVVAGLGIVGALASPVLVEADASNLTVAFMAVALLSATGVLIWRRWDWLATAAFLVSAPQLLTWVEDTYGDRLGLTLAVLLLFWGIHVIAATGYELRVPTAALRPSSGLLLLGNAVLVAGVGYFVLNELEHDAGATAWVLAISLVHLVLGVVGTRIRISSAVAVLMLAVGLALSAIGFALALDGPALVVGWSVEAAVLAWLARRTGDGRAEIGVAVFLVLAAGHLLAFEAPADALREGVDDLAETVVGLAVFAASVLVSARLYGGRAVHEWTRALEAAGAAALVYLASIAIVDIASTDGGSEPGQTPQVLLSGFWSVTGLTGLIYGLVRDDRRFRAGGFVLLGLAVFKVFLYDLSELESIYRVLSFIALGLLLLGAAFAYQRLRLVERVDDA